MHTFLNGGGLNPKPPPPPLATPLATRTTFMSTGTYFWVQKYPVGLFRFWKSGNRVNAL